MRCGKIVCVGQNYREHIREMRSDEPTEPVLFLKPSTALISDGEAIIIPEGIGAVHHEVELALIVGKGGEADRGGERPLPHLPRHGTQRRDRPGRPVGGAQAGLPWALAKGMDTFAPLGEPVPLDLVPDIHSLDLELRVNGEPRQKGNTAHMIFPPERLIAYISRFMTLEPGDVIATGTPSGVGPLRPGDLVEATVHGVGTLRNPVRSR